MKSPYEMFGTDKNLEAENGVKIDYGSFSITIHRAGGANKKFARVLNEKIKPVRQRHERGLLSDDESRRILIECYAEAVIIGWHGVVGKDGKEMQFNVANVVTLLTDLPDLFNDIQAQASNAANFLLENEAVEEKN